MDVLLGIIDRFLKDEREDDLIDRFTYKFTPFLFLVAAAVNTAKLYMSKVIECFTKAEFPRGWIEYTKDYCFVENTYYLFPNETEHKPYNVKDERLINYYQWVPFILALQALSFYVPHLLFRSFNWVTGYHIYSVISTSIDNQLAPLADRKKAVTQIANVLYRASSNKHQPLAAIQRGKFVSWMYLAMKFAHIVLCCFHMIVFKVFIGNFFFALDVLRHGVEWKSSGLFPRVTLCDMQILRFGAPLNYTMECVLPMNMINEKIFIFFYFWMIVLFGINMISTFIWLQRLANRRQWFRKLLLSFSADDQDWRAESASSPDGHKTPINIGKADKHGVTEKNLEYGWDMRLVLGLINEHVGLIMTSSIFREVNRLKEEAGTDTPTSTSST